MTEKEKQRTANSSFGKMAGLVLNRTFGFLINFSAKLKVNASKSATAPSAKTSACEKTSLLIHLAQFTTLSFEVV